MFVLRSLNGQIMKSTVEGEGEKEIQYETYGQAHQALAETELSLPKDLFKIVALDCERCDGNNDVTIFHVNDEPKAFCFDCRVEVFARKKPVGRPVVGVTKKISLTLSEESWEWLDENAEGNRSGFLREIVSGAFENETK